jgi:uncharacterized phage protein gp47/JayE
VTAGLSSSGFTAKTLDEILADLQARQRGTVDSSLNNSASSVIANLNASYALQLAQLWEVAGELWDAHDPNSAEGVAADHNGALIGLPRQLPTKARVTLQLTLDANAFVAAGSVVSDPSRPTVRFVTLTDVLQGNSPGTASVDAEAESEGLITAGANTLTQIESPASGWIGVTNPDPSAGGNDQESNEQYRARRATEIAKVGGSTTDGIKADVRTVAGVRTVSSIENDEDVTSGDGLPPHSFEIIVRADPGSEIDLAIGRSIYADKPAGVQTHGSTSVTVTDDDGVSHVVSFTRATQVPINIKYHADVDSSYVALSLEGALYTATVDPSSPAYWDAGTPVYLARLLVLGMAVPGVVNLTMDIARAPATPADAIPDAPNVTLGMGPRELPIIGTITSV